MIALPGRGATIVGIALAMAACSALSCSSSSQRPPDGTNGAGGGGGGGGGSGGGAGSCTFASTPTPFALPSISSAPTKPLASMGSGSVACTSGSASLAHQLIDLNADGFLDLVITSTCDDTTVGVSTWLVYPGSAAGFATTATRYALPPAPAASCGTTSALVDVTGDLRPDIVITTTCTDAYVGTARWLVYANGATGFAQTATTYALPPGATTGAFSTTSKAASDCTGGHSTPAFALLDVTGDAVADIVETSACDDGTIGTAAWRVFAGGASGVAQTATRFALPTTPSVSAGSFTWLTGSLGCTQASAPAFGLFDVSDDGKLDLVVTAACADSSVGASHWLYYANNGTGFAATPATFALPTIAGAPTNAFSTLQQTATCTGASQPGYSLVDANGDYLLDLVVTRDCSDPQAGVDYWKFYPNEGKGFATTARELTLPSALNGSAASPLGLAGTMSCAGTSQPAFQTSYFPKTSLALTVTSDCNDSSIGQTRWMTYAVSCK